MKRKENKIILMLVSWVLLALLENGPKNGSKDGPKSPNLLKSMPMDPYMLLKSSKAS